MGDQHVDILAVFLCVCSACMRAFDDALSFEEYQSCQFCVGPDKEMGKAHKSS